MRWFGSWRIRTQLAVLLTVALAPAALLLLGTYRRAVIDSRRDAERAVEAAAVRLAAGLSEEAAAVRGVLDTVAADLRREPESEWPAVVESQLDAHRALLATLIVISLRGHVIVGPARTAHLPIYVGDRPYFRDALATRGLAVGEYALSRSADRPAIHFATPLLDDRGNVRVVLAAGLDMAHCARLAQSTPLPDGASYSAVDRRGTVLFSGPSPNARVGQPEQPGLVTAMRDSKGAFVTGQGDAAMLHGSARVSLAKGAPPYAYVRFSLPLARVVAEQRAHLGVDLAWLTAATLLAVALAWVMWHYGLARRLDRLLAAATSLAQGDLTARTGLADPHHELAPLARVLDQAAQALADRESERRDAEAALRDSLEHLPLAVGIVDSAGAIRLVNRRHVELFGYPHERIPTIDEWLTLAYPDPEQRARNQAQWHADIAEAQRVGGATPPREYTVVCADGRRREVEITHRPLRDIGITAFVDVTERNALARERLTTEQRRLRSQTQESIDALAGGVAHDFNNLLTTIIGGIELASMGLDRDSAAAGDLRAALAAAHQAADLTSQMLAYTGHAQRQPSDVDLSTAARAAAGAMLPVLGERSALNLALARGLPLIEADPNEVERLIVSLITNSLEAMGERTDGVITVRTGVADYDASALAASCTAEPPAAGRFVWVEVEDNGMGMDEETQRRLFEPFFSTKFAGRGLSLAAVQGSVEAHGGGILVASEPDRGATVRLLFALPQAERRHLLVVDDDDDVRELALSLAGRLGFDAVGAADGSQALGEARRLGTTLALVLLDLSMPDRDGGLVLADLRELAPDLPVIVCSGHDREATMRQLAHLQPTGFLAKPFTMAAFADAVSAGLGQTS